MKVGIFFTGSGPILLLTSYDRLDDPQLIDKLKLKGIKKFIAFELPEVLAREQYGLQFNMVMRDLNQSDDLRVLDYDGHHIFNKFAFEDMSEPIFHEQ